AVVGKRSEPARQGEEVLTTVAAPAGTLVQRAHDSQQGGDRRPGPGAEQLGLALPTGGAHEPIGQTGPLAEPNLPRGRYGIAGFTGCSIDGLALGRERGECPGVLARDRQEKFGDRGAPGEQVVDEPLHVLDELLLVREEHL